MADNKDRKYMTPEGRLINGSLWEREKYVNEQGQEGKELYKVEMAFAPDDLAELEDLVVAAAVAKWGVEAEADYDNGKIQSPILDGNELAANREKKGKKGDAYKGKLVIRAHSKFNGDGADAPGGAYIAGPDTKRLTFEERARVYNGCMGRVVVTPNPWQSPQGRGVTLYLNGFQLTGEGERLMSNSVAGAFTPVGAAAAPATGGRRSRKG